MSSRAKIIFLLVAAICVVAFIAGRGSHEPLVDLGFRLLNLALFVALIVYLAGGKIAGALRGRSAGIAKEISSLEEAKAQAMRNVKDVERRIASLHEERQSILASYRSQGEALKYEIIGKAEKTAAQIVAQAKASARNEMDKAVGQLRAEISEEIIAAAEELLAERLDAAGHEKLIDKSLTKVVLN
ncbi:MAG: ATP synthase F0 subunit B [Deltaproteobacteria bacterium]|nr:ATP synthase F0 subunit B [Deltaproteobacteria bacterium]